MPLFVPYFFLFCLCICCIPSSGTTAGQRATPSHPVQAATPAPLISQQQFISAFHATGYPVPVNASSHFSYFLQALHDAHVTTVLETAMLLTHILWESGGLRYKVELACQTTQCPGQYHDTVSLPGRYYYGRGYIQLSWGKNYLAASKAMFDDDRLLRTPNLVAVDESLAWRSAGWFWSVNVHPRLAVLSRFGVTTLAVNPIECTNKPLYVTASKRYSIFVTIANTFGVHAAALPGPYGCYPVARNGSPYYGSSRSGR